MGIPRIIPGKAWKNARPRENGRAQRRAQHHHGARFDSRRGDEGAALVIRRPLHPSSEGAL